MTSKTKASTSEAIALRKQVGRWLKALRERRDLTQVQASDFLGYQYYTFLAQIEQGRSRVPPEDWVRWARLYRVDPVDFSKRLLAHYDPHVFAAVFRTHADGEEVYNGNSDTDAGPVVGAGN